MKTLIIALHIAALMSIAACAQKIAEVKVPTEVTSAFKAKFPDAANAKWELENTNEYEANFKLNGEEVSANFDNSGKWLETETEIKVSDLPAAVQTALSTEFSGFKVEEASKVESAENGSGFEAEVEKGEETFDVLFSADGQMISKTQEEEEKNEKDEKD